MNVAQVNATVEVGVLEAYEEAGEPGSVGEVKGWVLFSGGSEEDKPYKSPGNQGKALAMILADLYSQGWQVVTAGGISGYGEGPTRFILTRCRVLEPQESPSVGFMDDPAADGPKPYQVEPLAAIRDSGASTEPQGSILEENEELFLTAPDNEPGERGIR